MAANVITQGAGVVLGLQPKFDWKTVAQTAIAAPIAWAVGNAVGGKISGAVNSNWAKASGPSWAKFGRDIAFNLTTSGVRSALGGKFDVQQVVADAFGNAIGNSIVDKMGRSTTQPAKVTSKGAVTANPELNRNPISIDDEELRTSLMADNRAALERSINEMGMPELGPVGYTVKSGDSISKIIGTSDPAAVGAFMRANNLTSSMIRPGQELVIPSGGYTDADLALGQATLNADNARIAEYAARDQMAAEARGLAYFENQINSSMYASRSDCWHRCRIKHCFNGWQVRCWRC